MTSHDLYSRYGKVTDVRQTGKGYAFITMVDEDAARAAIRGLNGTIIGGSVKVQVHSTFESKSKNALQVIRVEWARERRKRRHHVEGGRQRYGRQTEGVLHTPTPLLSASPYIPTTLIYQQFNNAMVILINEQGGSFV